MNFVTPPSMGVAMRRCRALFMNKLACLQHLNLKCFGDKQQVTQKTKFDFIHSLQLSDYPALNTSLREKAVEAYLKNNDLN